MGSDTCDESLVLGQLLGDEHRWRGRRTRQDSGHSSGSTATDQEDRDAPAVETATPVVVVKARG
jgi:hypothetical protein